MHILLIEDEPQLQTLTARMLCRIFAAATVEIAASASKAIAAIASKAPALIVSDFDLGPGPNGGAVLAWIKNERPELTERFVFLSGNDAVLALHHRALLKPCSLAELRAALA